MNWVELSGPSGVGKSTFLELLVKNRTEESNWLTLNEGLCNSMKHGAAGFSKRMLSIYFRQNKINRFKNTLIRKRVEHYRLCKRSKYLPFIKVFSNSISEEPFPADDKILYINWYRKLVKEIKLVDSSNFEDLILLDEGLYSNLFQLEDKEWDLLGEKPKAFIFFHLNPETNFQRIKYRKERGILRNMHRNKSDHELMQYIVLDHERFRIRRKFIIQKGIPYLDLYLKKDSEVNIQKTRRFLEKIESR